VNVSKQLLQQPTKINTSKLQAVNV